MVFLDDLTVAEQELELGQGHVDRPELLEDVVREHDREPDDLLACHGRPPLFGRCSGASAHFGCRRRAEP
jgi:hypothetical protein